MYIKWERIHWTVRIYDFLNELFNGFHITNLPSEKQITNHKEMYNTIASQSEKSFENIWTACSGFMNFDITEIKNSFYILLIL